MMQDMHDKLSRTLSPPKIIDPWTVLPIELVEMILSYLTFREMVYVDARVFCVAALHR